MEIFLKHHNRTLLPEIYRKVHRYIVQACRDIEEYFIKKKTERWFQVHATSNLVE
jgi:hypothetical protein